MRGEKRLHARAKKRQPTGVSLRLVILQCLILRARDFVMALRMVKHIAEPLQAPWNSILLISAARWMKEIRKPPFGHCTFDPDHIQPLRSGKL
jgi:hypothetical protein